MNEASGQDFAVLARERLQQGWFNYVDVIADVRKAHPEFDRLMEEASPIALANVCNPDVMALWDALDYLRRSALKPGLEPVNPWPRDDKPVDDEVWAQTERIHDALRGTSGDEEGTEFLRLWEQAPWSARCELYQREPSEWQGVLSAASGRPETETERFLNHFGHASAWANSEEIDRFITLGKQHSKGRESDPFDRWLPADWARRWETFRCREHRSILAITYKPRPVADDTPTLAAVVRVSFDGAGRFVVLRPGKAAGGLVHGPLWQPTIAQARASPVLSCRCAKGGSDVLVELGHLAQTAQALDAGGSPQNAGHFREVQREIPH